MGAGAPLFSSPFGGASTDGAARDDSSPFSENAPGGPFGSASPFGASPFGAGAQTPSAPVGNVSSDIDEHHLDEPNIPSYALGRRTSVSAESLVPSHSKPFDPTHALIAEEDESSEGDAMPVFPKTAEQLTRIKDAIKPNFLFRNLDEEQEADILAAMKEVTVSPGETVIQQGDAGDYFYIVETGELDCFVKRDDQVIETEKGDRADLGKRVVVYKPGTSFGELALMHKYVPTMENSG
jgi:cAMP-dependent protein kinase regulator